MMTLLTRAVLVSLLVVILVGCGSAAPEYTPAPETLAAREAAEYTARIDKIQTVWYIVIGSFVLAMVIVLILAWQLRGAAYRVQAAKARKAEIENERLEFIDLGDGKAYHIPTKTVIATAQASSIAAPAMPAQALPATQLVNDSQYIAFLQRAAYVHPDKWHGKTIPGHREMGMSGGHWTACTRPMIDDELIETSPSGTIITEGRTLLDLYELIMANPY